MKGHASRWGPTVPIQKGRPTVMTSRSTLRMLLVTASVFAMASPLWGDDPKDEKTRAAEFHVIAKREAEAYTIRHLGSDRPLTLKPEPILKWSNPVRGSIYGDVFIWTENGRPEAVASIYKWYSPHTHRANEFHSLALDKLIGERDGVPRLDSLATGAGAKANSRRPRSGRLRGRTAPPDAHLGKGIYRKSDNSPADEARHAPAD